jgi:Phosphoenolpyruvate phosphomutase
MLVAGTFASWSRNLAAVGRSTGSLLRAVINTSIKYRLTPGIGKYSAQAVIRAGAKALATGSHPVADANGWPDGHRVPIDFVFANATRIADSTELPLTVDSKAPIPMTPTKAPTMSFAWPRQGRSAATSKTRSSAARACTRSRCGRSASRPSAAPSATSFHQRPYRPIPPGAVA